MIFAYQKINSFTNDLKKKVNLGINALNNYWNNLSQNYPFLPLFKYQLKNFKIEKELIVKHSYQTELYWTNYPYVEPIFRSVLKNINQDNPYIIFGIFQDYRIDLLDGIPHIENTVLSNSNIASLHTPINFFDDVFSLKSIKDMMDILKPYEEEYKKYLYDKNEIIKIAKTIKVLMSYLCMVLKRKKEQGESIDLNSIKSTLDNFDNYKTNKFYLKLLDDMNYLNKKVILTHYIRHYQISQIVWQIYFAHFLILEKKEIISSKTELTLRELIKHHKNFIFTPVALNQASHSQDFISSIFQNYTNILLKEEKAHYQVILPTNKIDNWDLCDTSHYKLILYSHDIDDKHLKFIQKQMEDDKILVSISHIQFNKLNTEQIKAFIKNINLQDILYTDESFVFLDNTWQSYYKLNEINQTVINEEHIELMKKTQLTIVDEIRAKKEKNQIEKALNEPILHKEEKKKRVKI